jgi:prophage regulatory protein
MALRILRVPDVLHLRGDSRSNMYREVESGIWTPPISFGPRFSGWPEHEAEALMAARIAGATPDELRKLVRSLMKKRKELMPSVDSPPEPQAA